MLDQMCPKLGDNGGAAVTAALYALQSRYSTLSDKQSIPIDYGALATQIGYVHKYAAAHADLIYCLLQRTRQSSQAIFAKNHVRMLCVGGGSVL